MQCVAVNKWYFPPRLSEKTREMIREGGIGGELTIMHGRSRMTMDPPRIPTMLGRRTSGFHRPGRHF